MASVRDTLQDEQSARNRKAQDPDDLMTAQLREAADQRAAMAQTEINQLQGRIEHFGQSIEQVQKNIEELAKTQPVPGTPEADLKAAQLGVLEDSKLKLTADLGDSLVKLDEANETLARAHEAKQNTELTSSLRQEPALHVDHTTHQSVGSQKVSDVLGRTSAQPKVPLRKQHSHGIH